jgi:glycine betaine/proline transport system permease protein
MTRAARSRSAWDGTVGGRRPMLDIMQTVPPWVYLIPAVIIFGLG